ncbi:hypothetical protein V6N12_000815 [Hibiscus sabdariffa]|uniref:Uncharacterized protein n=1 Tax=Hibiscus sabdariffa TaxID=183260 RepID=A0ABR2BXC1_9ROSI
MSQEQEQPAPASQSDQLSPAFDPRTFKRRFRNHLKRFRNHCDSKSPCELLRGGLETTAAVSLNSHLSYMFLYQGLKYKKGCEVSIPSEDMVELDDDDHGSMNPSIRLTVASSTEMDLVRDSIRDQIVEHMKLN